MSRVIGFEQSKPKPVHKATCPMCHAIIEYTDDDTRQIQHGEIILDCPNCGKWFAVG